MKIKFNIHYNTVFGENLCLDLLDDEEGKSHTAIEMHTNDGSTWLCVYDVPKDGASALEYHYHVTKYGQLERREWLVVKHRLALPEHFDGYVEVHDQWIDMPENSYLYTSAFTECLNRHDEKEGSKAHYEKQLTLKVRAPQLRSGSRLVMVGSTQKLGKWNPQKGLKMSLTQPCEWTAELDATLLTDSLEYKFAAIDSATGAVDWECRDNRVLSAPDMDSVTVLSVELGTLALPYAPTRVAGVVIPVFSLRSEGGFGVGDFGDLAAFVDWAASTGQRAVQLLPVNDTTITKTWTDSYPYNSISIYALHPQYADLRQLPALKDAKRAKYYEDLRLKLNLLPQIDYEAVISAKLAYLREVFEQDRRNILRRASFRQFFDENKSWLVPYAAFCHYRDTYNTATFSLWPDHNEPSQDEMEAMGDPRNKLFGVVAYWYYVQYVLDMQLQKAHDHARSRGVILKGDVPIGISRDGVEAWMEPRYFNLNGQAGAPPDAFSVNGQNWGFPTYNWDVMLKDGCQWWKRRFRKMAEYFDAYRIDHVLGFFRIWEIPIDAVHGLLGQFSPALPMTRDEIRSYGFNFQEERYTTPFITDWVLERVFHERAEEVKATYLLPDGDRYKMRPEYDTQRKVEAAFRDKTAKEDLWLRDGLYALISDVLFVRDRKNPELFHPRISAQLDFVYESLYDCDKQAFNHLYNDYFYRRHSQFWYREAMKKLPLLTQSTRMLVCAEDLGMVPECVPWVMNELNILTLEIQSMPKDEHLRFGILSANPYRSVCTISTHDMPTLRQWWDEDLSRTQDYYNSVLWRNGAAPHPLTEDLARNIVKNHLDSRSMLCLLSLQDWLATDETLRLPDADAERINIPSNPRHYWRYRMHITIEQLMANDHFNSLVKQLIESSGR